MLNGVEQITPILLRSYSPQNLIYRSPDREDIDMGNMLAVIKWYPSQIINFEGVFVPFYRSSVLIVEPVHLPDNVLINQISTLMTDKKMHSLGLKGDLHIRGIDFGISWFDGYDPMPGIALTAFNLDISGTFPIPLIDLTMTPYKISVLGIDFETIAGSVGLRGEAAWTTPQLSSTTYEYVPAPDIKWVAGVDWSSGIWRIIGEYSGKTIRHFQPSTVDPIIGTEPDYSALSQLYTVPGFDPASYIREQVRAFNRLYNYQLKRNYHSVAVRVESDMLYGKLVPSIFSMYNLTSHDLLFIPEIRFKPADGLTITAGGEFYSGRSGSLYDIVDEFMNSIYLTLRVDF